MTNSKEEKQKSKESRIEPEKNLENLAFRDIKSSYLFWRNFTPETPYEEYFAKKRCVEDGKELMPTDLKYKTEQERIDGIYVAACTALNKAGPNKRKIKYDFQDFGKAGMVKIYHLTADDANEAQSKDEEYEKIEKNFERQQYQTHTKELQEIDNQIFHVLAQKNIIKKEDKPSGELLEDWMKEEVIEAKKNL